MKPLDFSKVPEYIWTGRDDVNWYEECQQLFEKHFGKERLILVTKLFAATSINTSLKANVQLFRKALYELDNGKDFSSYLPNIKTNLELAKAGLPLSGRKISSFARAMSGDPDAVVVDIWLLRAFGCTVKGEERNRGATKREYDAIEAWCREAANGMKLQARQVSSIIWAGVRIQQSGDKGTHYKQHLDYSMNNLFGVL